MGGAGKPKKSCIPLSDRTRLPRPLQANGKGLMEQIRKAMSRGAQTPRSRCTQAEKASLPMKSQTTVQRKSERELVVTRTFNAPSRSVFGAWTRPELFKRWWVPKSMGEVLRSCDMDVRTGGGYRLVFGDGDSEPMSFHGKYVDVIPNARLVWTNEESDDGAMTSVTFEEKDGRTQLAWHELYSSREAADNAVAEMEGAVQVQFEQLDELLASGAGQS
jgi:uncharacterized protein YndB with AHSA1/START domain